MGTIVKNGVNYSGSGGQGTNDYDDLINQPQINGVILSGNKTPDALGLVTKAVNDLVNYYLKSETYSKNEVDTIVTAIKNSRFEVVATLPTSEIKTNVIYLVPKTDAESGDIKDEYINLDGTTAGWERIGSTDIDLSGYVTTTALNTALANYTTTTDLTALLAGKQDKVQYSTLPTASAELEGKIFEYTGATGGGLTHGYFYECVSDGESTPTYSWQQTNVQPNSGGGGSYTAGDGIDITNDKISTKQSEEGDIDKIVDVYPQAGNLVSIVNAFNKGDIYNTEERMIGQWTNGKPLYAKTFYISSLPNSTTVEYSLDVSNVEYIAEVTGVARVYDSVTNENIIRPLPYIASSSIGLWTDTKNGVTVATIYTTSDRSDHEAYIMLKYTKSTDVAISIGEATEYSTDEKVVGTWIDGKPVYQKTIDCGHIAVNTTTEVDMNIDNMDKVISITTHCSNSASALSVPYVNTTNIGFGIEMWIIYPKIKFRTGDDYSKMDCYVTIQYTKTTT